MISRDAGAVAGERLARIDEVFGQDAAVSHHHGDLRGAIVEHDRSGFDIAWLAFAGGEAAVDEHRKLLRGDIDDGGGGVEFSCGITG